MTRILSVFNLLKRVGFAVLFLGMLGDFQYAEANRYPNGIAEWSVPHFLDSQMCSDRWGCGV